MKLNKRKTLQELMLIEGIPVWIIEMWLWIHAPNLVTKMADGLGVGENRSHVIRGELVHSMKRHRHMTHLVITGCALFAISGLFMTLDQKHGLVFLVTAGIGAGMAVISVLSRAESRNQLEKDFIRDFYRLIDAIRVSDYRTSDTLWILLVDESRESFLQGLHRRLESFAKETSRSLIDLAGLRAPTLPRMKETIGKDRFNPAWEALLAFGFTEDDLGQSRDEYFRIAHEMLRSKDPDQTDSPSDDRSSLDAGARSRIGG